MNDESFVVIGMHPRLFRSMMIKKIIKNIHLFAIREGIHLNE